jgi:hypothetical protein
MLHRNRHLYLLCSLAFLIFGFPFVDESRGWLLTLMLVLILLMSIFAMAVRRYELVLGTILTLLIAGFSFIPHEDDVVTVGIVGPVLGMICFGYIVVLMLRRIFLHTRDVSLDTIYVALSAYLMLGVVFAQAFTVIAVVQPGSFESSGVALAVNAGSFDRLLGFSFVTLTTLGYGNIVPILPRAVSIAVAEALIGQIYLTVLLARLVAMELAARRQGPREDEADEADGDELR